MSIVAGTYMASKKPHTQPSSVVYLAHQQQIGSEVHSSKLFNWHTNKKCGHPKEWLNPLHGNTFSSEVCMRKWLICANHVTCSKGFSFFRHLFLWVWATCTPPSTSYSWIRNLANLTIYSKKSKKPIYIYTYIYFSYIWNKPWFKRNLLWVGREENTEGSQRKFLWNFCIHLFLDPRYSAPLPLSLGKPAAWHRRVLEVVSGSRVGSTSSRLAEAQWETILRCLWRVALGEKMSSLWAHKLSWAQLCTMAVTSIACRVVATCDPSMW